MCYITATQLKNNLGHYLELSEKEDVYITRNGKVFSVLTSPQEKALDDFVSLCEEIHQSNKNGEKIDGDEALRKEILKRCGF